MKKLLCLFFVFIILFLLIISTSATSIVGDGNSVYTLTQICSGLYYVCPASSPGEIIDYVITYDFIEYLDYIYNSRFKGSDEFKNGEDFLTYLNNSELANVLVFNEALENFITVFQSYKFTSEIDDELEIYNSYLQSHGNAQLTPEGFSEYLMYNNKTLYNVYMNGSYSLSSEMFASGNSSSSGGSSGSTTPGENKGENYGKSHTNDNHKITDSDCCYNPGYNDGLLDGGVVFQNSEKYQNIINENKTEAVEQFKQSNEYKETLESIRVEADEYAVDNYLKSEEYEATKDSCYAAGSNVGYTNAYSDLCSDVYYRGVVDGYSSFRGSNDHIADMDSSYRMGYDDGVSTERKNAVNPGAVIALMIILFVLLAVLISLFQIKKKKRR